MVELTALSSRNGRAIAHYIYFIDNLLLSPTVKVFAKSLNS